MWFLVLAILNQPAIAGEYFTEEVSNPSVAVIHGWRHQEADLELSLTNSDTGTFQVPWEVNRPSCDRLEMRLNDGSSVSFAPDTACTVNVFPQLDKLINLQVSELQIISNGEATGVTLTEADQVALANVANLSRDAFLLFQNEIARAIGQSPASTPNMTNPATPPPPLNAPTSLDTPGPINTFGTTEPPPIPVVNTVATPMPAPLPTASDGTFNTGTVAPTAGQLVIVGDIREEFVSAGSQLTVEAINTGTTTVLSAQARFQFFSQDRIVDNRIVAFTPNDVSPGTTATASVLKTDENWDRVSVSFIWAQP